MKFSLKASLALWKRRVRSRKRAAARAEKNLKSAQAMVTRRRKQIAARRKPTRAKGIDVSNLQGRVDFGKVKRAGYRFVWLKATEGATFRDAFFQDNVRAARAAGLKVGAYHFLRSSSSVKAQVNAFLDAVRVAKLGRGDLLPVIDVEAKGVTPALARDFADQVEKRLGIRPLIYTYPAFTSWPSTFGCRLWIAHYDVKKPTLPRPWQAYAAWQHSSKGSVPGVNGRCDVNVTDDLQQLLA